MTSNGRSHAVSIKPRGGDVSNVRMNPAGGVTAARRCDDNEAVL